MPFSNTYYRGTFITPSLMVWCQNLPFFFRIIKTHSMNTGPNFEIQFVEQIRTDLCPQAQDKSVLHLQKPLAQDSNWLNQFLGIIRVRCWCSEFLACGTTAITTIQFNSVPISNKRNRSIFSGFHIIFI